MKESYQPFNKNTDIAQKQNVTHYLNYGHNLLKANFLYKMSKIQFRQLLFQKSPESTEFNHRAEKAYLLLFKSLANLISFRKYERTSVASY